MLQSRGKKQIAYLFRVTRLSFLITPCAAAINFVFTGDCSAALELLVDFVRPHGTLHWQFGTWIMRLQAAGKIR